MQKGNDILDVFIKTNMKESAMVKVNPQWGQAIRNLKEKYGLTYRDMERKVNREVSYPTIYGWATKDDAPTYESAVKFLAYFPEERVESMKIAGHPIPKEWLSEMSEAEAIETVLERKLDPIDVIACELRTSGKLTEEQQAVAMDQIRGFVDKIKKEYKIE
jgi:transcriptional regulator with XRE-family HTH domain